MKKFLSFYLGRIALFLVLAISGHSATITWTNTEAGNWSVAANWSPNQVPGAADTAVIPIAGSNGVVVDMTVTLQNLILTGGNLNTGGYSYDVLTVSGQINWTNGVVDCVITNNGVMTLAGTNGVDYILAQPLYNAGTFNLVSGNLLVNSCGYDYGGLFNLAGSLLDIQHDAALDISSNQFGLCNSPLSNAGTIRKSGGTGTSYIYLELANSGTVDAQMGAISFNGGGDLNGTLQSEGSGELVLATNIYNTTLALDGNLNSTNVVLDGAELVGSGAINGMLTWIAGGLLQGDGALTVGTNGVLLLAGINGVDYSLSSELYNNGTIKLVSGNLLINYCGSGFGELINNPSGLVDIESDVSIDSPCDGQLINLGIVRKSGGTGTSDISAYFNNQSGILDAASGLIGLTNNYDIGGGTLSFDLNGVTSYGRIYLAGNPTLSGTLSVNLNNGYTPTNGSVFSLLSYGSENGAFSSLALPSWVTWETNYGPAAFTLSVLNNQPIINGRASYMPGQFSFQFAGNSNASYSVLATTNLMLPLADWTVLGPAMLISNNLFQYLDAQTTNYPQQFYRLRSP